MLKHCEPQIKQQKTWKVKKVKFYIGIVCLMGSDRLLTIFTLRGNNFTLGLIYSLSLKPWTLEKISAYVYCFATNQMQYETVKDNGQATAGISHDLIWDNEVAFLLWEIFNFLIRSRWKSYFLITNQHQLLDSVCSKTTLPNRPNSECKLGKFTVVQVCVMGECFSPSKNTDQKPPMTTN